MYRTRKEHLPYLRALGLALGVLLVPIASALVLVPVSPRRHAFALQAAYAAVLQAPVLNSSFVAPPVALRLAKIRSWFWGIKSRGAEDKGNKQESNK